MKNVLFVLRKRNDSFMLEIPEARVFIGHQVLAIGEKKHQFDGIFWLDIIYDVRNIIKHVSCGGSFYGTK